MRVATETCVTVAEVVDSDLRTLLREYKEELIEVHDTIRPLLKGAAAARALRHKLNPLKECYYTFTGKATVQFSSHWPANVEAILNRVEAELKAVSAFLER